MNAVINYRNQAEVQKAGLDALIQRLGRVGTIRFLQLYHSGSGDSVKEKHERDDTLNMSMDDIADDINKMLEQ